jgi:hypothetical protein
MSPKTRQPAGFFIFREPAVFFANPPTQRFLFPANPMVFFYNLNRFLLRHAKGRPAQLLSTSSKLLDRRARLPWPFRSFVAFHPISLVPPARNILR